MAKRKSNKQVKQMMVDSFHCWNPCCLDNTLHDRWLRCSMEVTHTSKDDYYDTNKEPVSLTANQLKGES